MQRWGHLGGKRSTCLKTTKELTLGSPRSDARALLEEKTQPPEYTRVWRKSLQRGWLDFTILTAFVIIFLPGLTFYKCAFN